MQNLYNHLAPRASNRLSSGVLYDTPIGHLLHQASDGCPYKCNVTIRYPRKNTTPPIYIATSFTSPPWQLYEMSYDSSSHTFYKDFDNVSQGEHQYKFKLGPGDWWVLDDSAPTVLDAVGNVNNLLIIHPLDQKPRGPSLAPSLDSTISFAQHHSHDPEPTHPEEYGRRGSESSSTPSRKTSNSGTTHSLHPGPEQGQHDNAPSDADISIPGGLHTPRQDKLPVGRSQDIQDRVINSSRDASTPNSPSSSTPTSNCVNIIHKDVDCLPLFGKLNSLRPTADHRSGSVIDSDERQINSRSDNALPRESHDSHAGKISTVGARGNITSPAPLPGRLVIEHGTSGSDTDETVGHETGQGHDTPQPEHIIVSRSSSRNQAPSMTTDASSTHTIQAVGRVGANADGVWSVVVGWVMMMGLYLSRLCGSSASS